MKQMKCLILGLTLSTAEKNSRGERESRSHFSTSSVLTVQFMSEHFSRTGLQFSSPHGMFRFLILSGVINSCLGSLCLKVYL